MDTLESVSFGDLVKTFRKKRSIKQQELSEKLGVHYNTISKWERGICLPDSKGMVLELAKWLCLDERETRVLLEASLTALSPYWSVPHQRNPFFTGREEILGELHASLRVEQAGSLVQSYALYGLGGIGKTQIALEYAYRHMLEYAAVFWIEAETSASILSSLGRVAGVLQLPECQDANQQRIVTIVQRWLATHNRWLMIWDNLEDLDRLAPFLPFVYQGAFLITTRDPVLGTVAWGLGMLPMGQEEGTLFLLRRAKVLERAATREQVRQFAQCFSAEYVALEQLVTEVDGLPLALDQAAAYIEETGCSFLEYLRQYERQHQSFLAQRGMCGGNHPDSVLATLRLSCQRIAQHTPAALELLRCCAFCAPDAIPEELFGTGASLLGPVLGPIAADPSQLNHVLAVLRSVSLLQRHRETRTLSMHRLVQVMIREEIDEQERILWTTRVMDLLNRLFPPVIPERWGECERLLPHVLACAALIPDHAWNEERTEGLRKAADYLRERAQYEQAQALYTRVLRIQEQIHGTEHPLLVPALNGLANLSYRQGKYEQARAFYGRALRIQEQALGAEHPDLAFALNGLASLSYRQGKYDQAQALYERALRIQEQALGPEHPNLALSLHGLVDLLGERAQYQQARFLCERALRLQEQALGSEHPLLAIPLSNLALLCSRQGKYEQARALYERALHIQERSRGPEHPLLVPPLTNLADLLLKQEEYEQAQGLYERALRLWEQAHGSEHPNLAYPLNGLADLLLKQEKYEQAQGLYERALRLREQAYGSEHPDLAYPLSGLADLLLKQEEYEHARGLYERALRLLEQTRGPLHPDLARPLSGLATLLLRKGQYEQGKKLHERALYLLEQAYGAEHPETIKIGKDFHRLCCKKTDLSKHNRSSLDAEM